MCDRIQDQSRGIYVYIYIFFNKYRSSFSPAQNRLRSELSSLWSHLSSPSAYPVLPLILPPPLGSPSCFLNRANMLLSPGLYAWSFFLECRRLYTSFFSYGEAMRKILRQGVALVMRVIIVWRKYWFGQKVHSGLPSHGTENPNKLFGQPNTVMS